MEDNRVKELNAEALPVATRMACEITDLANKHPRKEIRIYAVLAASLVFQRIVISVCAMMFRHKSDEGRQWLQHIYEDAHKDALVSWDKGNFKPVHFH